jgi:hypothetical protein
MLDWALLLHVSLPNRWLWYVSEDGTAIAGPEPAMKRALTTITADRALSSGLVAEDSTIIMVIMAITSAITAITSAIMGAIMAATTAGITAAVTNAFDECTA